MKDNTAISKIARSFDKGLDELGPDKSPPSNYKRDGKAPSLQDLSRVYGGTLKRSSVEKKEVPLAESEPRFATMGRVKKDREAFNPKSSEESSMGKSFLFPIRCLLSLH